MEEEQKQFPTPRLLLLRSRPKARVRRSAVGEASEEGEEQFAPHSRLVRSVSLISQTPRGLPLTAAAQCCEGKTPPQFNGGFSTAIQPQASPVYPSCMHLPGGGVPTRGASHWVHPLRVERATCQRRMSCCKGGMHSKHPFIH